jgi:hypothetical protein
MARRIELVRPGPDALGTVHLLVELLRQGLAGHQDEVGGPIDQGQPLVIRDGRGHDLDALRPRDGQRLGDVVRATVGGADDADP